MRNKYIGLLINLLLECKMRIKMVVLNLCNVILISYIVGNYI